MSFRIVIPLTVSRPICKIRCNVVPSARRSLFFLYTATFCLPPKLSGGEITCILINFPGDAIARNCAPLCRRDLVLARRDETRIPRPRGCDPRGHYATNCSRAPAIRNSNFQRNDWTLWNRSFFIRGHFYGYTDKSPIAD